MVHSNLIHYRICINNIFAILFGILSSNKKNIYIFFFIKFVFSIPPQPLKAIQCSYRKYVQLPNLYFMFPSFFYIPKIRYIICYGRQLHIYVIYIVISHIYTFIVYLCVVRGNKLVHEIYYINKQKLFNKRA